MIPMQTLSLLDDPGYLRRIFDATRRKLGMPPFDDSDPDDDDTNDGAIDEASTDTVADPDSVTRRRLADLPRSQDVVFNLFSLLAALVHNRSLRLVELEIVALSPEADVKERIRYEDAVRFAADPVARLLDETAGQMDDFAEALSIYQRDLAEPITMQRCHGLIEYPVSGLIEHVVETLAAVVQLRTGFKALAELKNELPRLRGAEPQPLFDGTTLDQSDTPARAQTVDHLAGALASMVPVIDTHEKRLMTLIAKLSLQLMPRWSGMPLV